MAKNTNKTQKCSGGVQQAEQQARAEYQRELMRYYPKLTTKEMANVTHYCLWLAHKDDLEAWKQRQTLRVTKGGM